MEYNVSRHPQWRKNCRNPSSLDVRLLYSAGCYIDLNCLGVTCLVYKVNFRTIVCGVLALYCRNKALQHIGFRNIGLH